MLTLIIGGAASGKSAFAEELATKSKASPKIYLATMLPFDDEGRLRVKRHREQRGGKGFHTMECPSQLDKLEGIPGGSCVLLECLTNLLSNEIYLADGAGEEAVPRILNGVDKLCREAEEVIVVSGEIFSDGCEYEQATEDYLEKLATLNHLLAARADRVAEVVCSIPIFTRS